MAIKSGKYSMQHTEYWMAISTLGLLSSAYRDLHYWSSDQQPQKAEPELYHWVTDPHHTKYRNIIFFDI